MKAKQIVSVIAIITLTSSLMFAGGKPEQEAQKSAEQWLALVDGGKFTENWKATSPVFQAAVSQAQWEIKGKQIRKSFGNVISSELKSAQYTKSVPGAPDGEYVILQFDTSFSNKKTAVETVTPMRDKDGRWKVSGYYIK